MNESLITKESLVAANTDLVERWAPMLDGTTEAPLSKNTPRIEDDYDRYVMAKLLDNAERSFARMEDVATTQVFGQNYIPTVLGMIRQTYPRMNALDLVAVQPLDRPSGRVYYMDTLRSDGTRTDLAANPTAETKSIEALGRDWESYRNWASKGENEFIDKEVSLTMSYQDVTTRSSKMKYRYTIELQQDFAAYWNMDASAILEGRAIDELAMELDQQIIAEIRANIGAGTVTYGTQTPTTGGYDYRSWRSRLYRALLNASELIVRWRGQEPTWAICGSGAMIELLDTEQIDTTGAVPVQKANGGIRPFGIFGGQLQMFHVPWMRRNEIILGRKGGGFEDAGLIFLPYILLWAGEKVFDAEYQRYVRSFMSRYGTKVVDPHNFARVIIDPNSSGIS